MRILTTGLLAGLAAVTAAQAQTFEGQDTIVLRDVFGTVTVDFSAAGPITVDASGQGADALEIGEGGNAVIVGGEAIDAKRWEDDYRRTRRRTAMPRHGQPGEDKVFDAMLEDRPTITVSAPAGTDIRIEDSAVKVTGDGSAGVIGIDENVHLLVKLGDAEAADINLRGHGYVSLGEIAEQLQANLQGSGDIVFVSAGSADLGLQGSGDIEGERVNGRMSARLQGSGDIELGRIAGDAEAKVDGSGDIELGEVAGSLDAHVNGSGDLKVASVSGPVEASVHGSGDMEIEDGDAPTLTVSVRGSGSFVFGGTAGDADLTSRGSGSVRVGRVTGTSRIDGDNMAIGSRSGD